MSMKNVNILDLSVRDLVGKLLPQIDEEFGIIKEPEVFEKKDLVNYIHFHTKGYDKRLAKGLYEDVIECKLNHEFYVFPKLANMWGSEEITILDKGGKEQDIYFYEDLGMIMNAYTDKPYDIVDWGKHKYKFKCQNYKDLINNQDVFSYIQKSEFEKLLKEYIYTYYSPLFWYVLDLIKEIAEDLMINATSTPNQIPDELLTDKAKGVLQIAINGGLLNNDYSLTDKVNTNPKKALLADTISLRIWGTAKYKVFERLWGCKGLAKARYKSREEIGKVRGGEIVTNIFK